MHRLELGPVARELVGVVFAGLLLTGCAGSAQEAPAPETPLPLPSASAEVASPAPDAQPDFGHVKATSPEEVLEALSASGLTCDWAPLDPDPSTDQVVNKCPKWGAYLWFSPTGTGAGFIDSARGDPKLKGYSYMIGDHWAMVGKPKIIVEMSRSIGGDGGNF